MAHDQNIWLGLNLNQRIRRQYAGIGVERFKTEHESAEKTCGFFAVGCVVGLRRKKGD